MPYSSTVIMVEGSWIKRADPKAVNHVRGADVHVSAIQRKEITQYMCFDTSMV